MDILPSNLKQKLMNMNKKQWLIVLLIGILLIIIAIPIEPIPTEVDSVSNATESASARTTEDYKTQMENQLEEILSQVTGVGTVQVMITLDATEEKIVEKDTDMQEQEMQEHTVYEEESEGQTPYVKQEIYPIVEGVLVIAQGGDNAVIIENITEAIQALFEVDTHKIKIMKMK